MAKSSLNDAAVRNQVYLERYKAAEAKEYNKVLAIVYRQVTEVLGKLDARVDTLARGKLNAMLRELKAAQQAALDKNNDALLARLDKLATYESNFEVRAINTLTPGSVTVVAPSAEAITAAVYTTPLSATGDLLEPFVRDMTKREVELINKVILRGHSEGWSNEQITRVLRGTKALAFKDGLLPRMGRHNRTLVNTAVQHVASTARGATHAANTDVAPNYKWVSTLDSHTTEQCRALDGQVFAVGEGPMPPIHMNCRSTTVPVLKGKLSILSEGRTRASASGQVDSRLTYYEWLKQQSADFQDDALGATRGKLFRDGGLSAERFAQLQLGSSFQPLTLEQMKKLEPGAFTRAGID